MIARTLRTSDPKRALAGLRQGRIVTLEVPRDVVEQVQAELDKAMHPTWRQRIRVRGSEAVERAGCIVLRTTSKGIRVGLYRSSESFERDPELPYTTVCETHSTLVSHETRRSAEQCLSHPEMWCDECREGPAGAAP